MRSPHREEYDLKGNDNNYRTGTLPDSYPLATALTPIQRSATPRYEPDEALSRGTLFPGLDLPFMNMVNGDLPSTPATELMAICFVKDELGLYLDTHADDTEAFELYQTILAMAEEARRRYTELCGPISQSDLLGMKRYAWLDDPWPWDVERRRG